MASHPSKHCPVPTSTWPHQRSRPPRGEPWSGRRQRYLSLRDLVDGVVPAGDVPDLPAPDGEDEGRAGDHPGHPEDPADRAARTDRTHARRRRRRVLGGGPGGGGGVQARQPGGVRQGDVMGHPVVKKKEKKKEVMLVMTSSSLPPAPPPCPAPLPRPLPPTDLSTTRTLLSCPRCEGDSKKNLSALCEKSRSLSRCIFSTAQEEDVTCHLSPLSWLVCCWSAAVLPGFGESRKAEFLDGDLCNLLSKFQNSW